MKYYFSKHFSKKRPHVRNWNLSVCKYVFRCVVQLLNPILLFGTPGTAACQTSLSFTISWSLLNSHPLSHWCHPTISSSVTLFSSYPQSFPISRSFPMSQLFTSGGQSIGASVSFIPVNNQGLFPSGLTRLISLLS